MAEDTTTAPENKNEITLSISEYNALKADAERAKILGETVAQRDARIAEVQTALTEAQKQTKGPKRDEIEAEIRAELGERITKSESEREQLFNRLKSITVTDKVMTAIQPRLIPSAAKWIRQEIEKECDIDGDFENGELVVKDEKGNVRWSAKHPDKKMTVDEYQEVLVSRYPEFFQATARGGEPVTPGTKMQCVNVAGTNLTVAQFKQMDDNQLRDLAKTNPREFDDLLSQVEFG